MKRSLPVDLSLVLSLATVLGMAMAVAGRWPAHEILGALLAPGLALVYLAGGFPTAWRAVSELWREHVLDIDLLMIAAAIADMDEDGDGWVNIGGIGNRLRNAYPDFDQRTYGHAKLSELIRATGRFDVEAGAGGAMRVRVRPK